MAAKPPIRALVVTGGHDFEREPFFALFQGLEGIAWQAVEHPHAHARFQPDAARAYDVLVLYDLWQTITPEAQRDFLTLLRQEKGVVALHHALAGYQDWPDYTRVIGGKFRTRPEVVDGMEKPRSTFRHNVRFTVRIVDSDHPVTRGLRDFEILDETYRQFETLPSVRPLLKTEEPTSGPVIGWWQTYAKSRVVYLQPGHDRHAYENPHYRRLVAQAIRWVAGKAG